MAACKGCGVGLEWEEEGGKWTAFEEETGQRHRCPNYGKLRTTPVAQPRQQRLEPTVPPADDKDYEVLRVLNRIEALLKELVKQGERSLV